MEICYIIRGYEHGAMAAQENIVNPPLDIAIEEGDKMVVLAGTA